MFGHILSVVQGGIFNGESNEWPFTMGCGKQMALVIPILADGVKWFSYAKIEDILNRVTLMTLFQGNPLHLNGNMLQIHYHL
jgi:hypothetical protein